VRVGVALMGGPSNQISAVKERDRLVKALNHHRLDKELKTSIEAVGLEVSQETQAIAEAKTKNCRFVLLTTLSQVGPAFPGMLSEIRAIIELQLAGVPDGTKYAPEMVIGEDPMSGEYAVADALKRGVSLVVAELQRADSMRHSGTLPVEPVLRRAVPEPVERDSSAAQSEPTVTYQPNTDSSAAEFCAWLATDIPHAEVLRNVCEFAMSLPRRMPNFICDEDTARYRESKPVDQITALLRYENERESYSEVKLDGRPAPAAVVAELSGLWSAGEFGNNLRSIFYPGNEPVFEFSGERKMGAGAAWVFAYRVPQQKDPVWWLSADYHGIAPAYSGELWVDQKTGELLRFELEANDIPKAFPTQSAEILTDYAKVGFDDGSSFVLPSDATVATTFRGVDTRNVVRFRNCHKFQAKSRMLLEVPPPKTTQK